MAVSIVAALVALTTEVVTTITRVRKRTRKTNHFALRVLYELRVTYFSLLLAAELLLQDFQQSWLADLLQFVAHALSRSIDFDDAA